MKATYLPSGQLLLEAMILGHDVAKPGWVANQVGDGKNHDRCEHVFAKEF